MTLNIPDPDSTKGPYTGTSTITPTLGLGAYSGPRVQLSKLGDHFRFSALLVVSRTLSWNRSEE